MQITVSTSSRGNPGVGEVGQERRLQVERLHARDVPVVADARVDDDATVARGDAERVDRQHEVAVVVDEVRAQPRRVRRDHVVGRRSA